MRVSPLLPSVRPLPSPAVPAIPSQALVSNQSVAALTAQRASGPTPDCEPCSSGGGSAVLVQASLKATHSEFSANLEGFRARGFSRSVTLEATLQDGDQQLRLRTEVTQTVLRFAVNKEYHGRENSLDALSSLIGRLPEGIRDVVADLGRRDSVPSASASADRLAALALEGIPAGERSTRTLLVDRMKELMADAFQEALALVGTLSEPARRDVDRVRELTSQRLEESRGVDGKA